MRKPNRTLWVFKYLWENTDDQHPATIAEIIAFLETQGITVKDYRAIQADIADLTAMGIDIVEDRSRHYEYSIGTRHFEVPEVKLLVDAVQSSRFISQKKSKALIKKLSSFVGPQDAGIIKRQLYVEQRFKATNEGIMRIVDSIQDAIAAKTKVTFQYYDYSPQKKKVARHDGAFYVVSPYSLIWNGDNYYMVGHSEEKDKIQKFRVDRIDHLSMVDEPRVKPPKDYNVGDFFSQEFSMMSGKETDVELLVENNLMNNIIDHFGERVKTEVVDEGHFKVYVTVGLSPTFYGWLFASKGKIKILNPKEAKDEFYYIIDSYSDSR
ncbi:MAG: WYL domain-containing protein [Oscillospiraceae bacterium]|nr:WYL domain-containing protein [Oscillospiraceae bacterium]